MNTKRGTFKRLGCYALVLVASSIAVFAASACDSNSRAHQSRDEKGKPMAQASWCHDMYAPEGCSWYAIHRDRCISDYFREDIPRCIKEIATGLETVRFMPGVTVGRNGERIFGNSWADYEGEPNTFGAILQGGRVEPIWMDTVGQGVTYGTPTIASMWRISRQDLTDLSGENNAVTLMGALRASSATWIYLTEAELVVEGSLLDRPAWLNLSDSRVEAGEIAMSTEAPYPADPTTLRYNNGEVSAIGYWGPGRGNGNPERIWQTRDRARLQSVAASGGNLTSDGKWAVQTANGDLLVFHRLTGEIIDFIRFSDEINRAFGHTGPDALTPDTTINTNSVAVGRNPETGLDHLYVALTHGRLQKMATAGGVNFELGEATGGYLAAALWDPQAESLSFYWADRLDMELSEASPTIHPVHGTIFSAFGKYTGVTDGSFADAATNLYAWKPDGTLLAELPMAGRTVASPAVVPANPEMGFQYDYVVIGAGMGKANMPEVFRFDPSDGSLTVVYEPREFRDPILTTNLYVTGEGLMFMGTIFPEMPTLLETPFFFAVFDIKEILREKPGAEIELVDRVQVRSVSCNNVAYDATNRRFVFSMVCAPDLLDVNKAYDPGASYGLHVIGEDPDDDPADGCEMEVEVGAGIWGVAGTAQASIHGFGVPGRSRLLNNLAAFALPAGFIFLLITVRRQY